MFKVEDGKIYLTRGDSAYLEVLCTNSDGTPYEFKEGDTLTLSIKTSASDTQYKVTKTISAVDEAFAFAPNDTSSLDCGKYYYDIQINTAIGEVFTIIGPAAFYLKEEITR